MLAGLTREERRKFHLDGVAEFRFLGPNHSAPASLTGRDWLAWRSWLDRLGIPFSDVARVCNSSSLASN